ncbi:MAG: YicC family protein [Clostridiales bacterium]|nr:YicC family protein [Clostridiales bacterium]
MRSMTGYGRRLVSRDGREMTVEIKTVNHRFLDVSLRMPRALSFAEEAVRKKLSQRLRRGHVDMNVTYLNLRADARIVRVDEGLVSQYQDAVARIGRILNGTGEIDLASFIAAQPDVMQVTVAEEDQEAVLQLLLDTMEAALSDVEDMRSREGEALRQDLSLHLDEVASLRDEIARIAPEVPRIYQEKLKARLSELGVQELDEQRLYQEVALMADRCAIDEELSRLISHFDQVKEALSGNGEVGRRLDFLVQELNREVNTIGSKASDARITKLVVAAKSEIEKLREQVQNVE